MAQIQGINNYLDISILDYFHLIAKLRDEKINSIEKALEMFRAELIKHYQHSTDLQLMAMVYTHYLYLYAVQEFIDSRKTNKSLF